MIKDNIESKLITKEHKKAYKKYRKTYQAIIRHLNDGERPMNKQVAALGKAALAVHAAHGIIPYDVQILSAIILMDGGILEVSTGEGKTLVAGMAACALSIMERQVHIYTPNDYLSERDSQFTKMVASRLGINCSYIVDGVDNDVKRKVFHENDIIYATERSVIFSYINDNANLSPDQDVLPKDLDFLIIDEADSILIDNGETPYILNGSSNQMNEYIPFMMPFAKMLNIKLMDHRKYEALESSPEGCHAVGNLHTRDVLLLDKAYADMEGYLEDKGVISNRQQIYRSENIRYIEALKTCLIALHTYQRDVNYVVEKGRVLVVDEHTGRILPTVRMNSGIHQAIESKEGVEVLPDSHVKGKITLESFVAKYKTIAGMSGTAIDVDEEMKTFYNLKVYCIPNNESPIREDREDKYFINRKMKFKAMIEDIENISSLGKPVLVGSSSVEEAEEISEMLNEKSIKHVLLTPKHAEQEASVIAQAGRPGRITVTTNMAGRGTDIVLGFNPDSLITQDHSEDERDAIRRAALKLEKMAKDAGGLHVIGTERSRSPRVDRQLAGRAGRQGDPGSSQFYVSPDDKIFKSLGKNVETLRKLLRTPENPYARASCRSAIGKIQSFIRMHSMEQKRGLRKMYGVHEQQMLHYYDFRNEIKYGSDEYFENWLYDVVFRGVHQLVLNYVDYERFDTDAITRSELDLFYFTKYVMYLDINESDISTGKQEKTSANIYNPLVNKLGEYLKSPYREEVILLLRETLLDACDEAWVGNIARVEDVNRTIHLRAYANEKPDIKYQQEAFSSYKVMIVDILMSIVSRVSALMSMLDEDSGRKIA